MSTSKRRTRPHRDSTFPAYFTKHNTPALGWPFILSLIGVIVIAFGSLALRLLLG